MNGKSRRTARAVRRSGASNRSKVIYASVAVVIIGLGALWYASQGSKPLVGAASSSGGDLKHVGTVKAADYHSLAFRAGEPNTVYFGHHNGVMRSSDGGQNWAPLIHRPSFDAMNLAVNPGAPDELWMAGHNVFYKSIDGGRGWQEVPTNLPGLDIHAFTVSARDPQSLYAFAVGFGLFKSSDGGATWQPFGPGAPQAPIALAMGGDPEALYIGTETGVVISRDGGATFSQPIAVEAGPISALAVRGNLVYAGTPKGLYRSEDDGQTWSRMGYSGFVAALAIDPTNPQRLLLIDLQGKVFSTV